MSRLPTLEHEAVPDHFGLTARERDVAFWLSYGKTNGEIAIILNIARRTVEKHVEIILRKLSTENRTTAAVMLRQPHA